MFWILNGLLKKIILSDYLAVNFIDRVFDNPMLFSGFENLMALFATACKCMPIFRAIRTLPSALAAHGILSAT